MFAYPNLGSLEEDFAHGGAGLAEMAAWLMSVTGAEASAIHVAIEIPHGPIVEPTGPVRSLSIPRRFGSVSPIGRFFAPFRPDNPHRCVGR
jgi:hypothetical protein